MKQLHVNKVEPSLVYHDKSYITDLTIQSFKKIAPFWPLKNLIAVNPLQGLEDQPIEEALKIAGAYFEQKDLPEKMEAVNRETIKWLQVSLDEGQSTISMPLREYGLYSSWIRLAVYDVKLHKDDKQKIEFLKQLPKTATKAIAECMLRLGIPKEDHGLFLTLMLTTLPGWASYIKYRTEWTGEDRSHPHPATQEDYLGVRLIITTLLWPEAKELINWHKKALNQSQSKTDSLEKIKATEDTYRLVLLKNLAKQSIKTLSIAEAQLVFCIDVRSEPFRKSIESIGDYQTFGFAGFFGIPVQINNTITNESYASCPVLFSPKHEVEESPCSHQRCNDYRKGYERLSTLKRLYQSVKYTFTTPFALVESMGIMSGLWMGIRSLIPNFAYKLKITVVESIHKPQELKPSLDNISLTDQCSYALNALRMMGFTTHFAPLIVLCGHGSTTQNNAYSTALDCGACGGRHGASNARILAAILNRSEVRINLSKVGITIPQTTLFIPAEHNTTTDEMTLYSTYDNHRIKKLKEDLLKARNANNIKQLQKMENKAKAPNAISDIWMRSQDWEQVRPEWGLARNSAFIVAPRDITSSLDLDGRCFLHSYDYKQDPDGSSLSVILTAPMVVAQWINMQYFFSMLDNVAYGGGSKVTTNITGKIGIMQGNASDLMTGLPLQSVYSSDTETYHELQRLTTVVFAPRYMLDKIIHEQIALQKLFGNGWVQIAAIEPDNRKIYLLNRDLSWQEVK